MLPYDSSDSFEHSPFFRPRVERAQHRGGCILILSVTANLVLFCLLLLAGPQYIWSASQTTSWRATPPPQLMSDINGIVPDFPTTLQTFTPDPRFATPSMLANRTVYAAVRATWSASMPTGHGFIGLRANTSAAYPALARETPWHLRQRPGRDGYALASFHALHCLFEILGALGEAVGVGEGGGEEGQVHVVHCFDYLRQSVLCAGDAALEGKSKTAGLERTDGWGVLHVCKSPEAVGRWVRENRFSDNEGI